MFDLFISLIDNNNNNNTRIAIICSICRIYDTTKSKCTLSAVTYEIKAANRHEQLREILDILKN